MVEIVAHQRWLQRKLAERGSIIKEAHQQQKRSKPKLQPALDALAALDERGTRVQDTPRKVLFQLVEAWCLEHHEPPPKDRTFKAALKLHLSVCTKCRPIAHFA
jgi:hypothetical protein